MYKLLGVLGGVPWYLEQINPEITVDSAIKQLCFEKDGVLRDANDDTSVIPALTYQQFKAYKASGVIYEGMIPKMDGAFYALQKLEKI